MITAFWSTKGGQGLSTTASLAAVGASAWGATTLVDLDGDQAALLGDPLWDRDGIAKCAQDGASLPRLNHQKVALDPIDPSLSLVVRGDGPLPAEYAELFIKWLRLYNHKAVVDVGSLSPLDCNDNGDVEFRRRVLAAADQSFAVTRPCFLSLRRFTWLPEPAGVVLVDEPGRALTAADVAEAVKAPVAATVPLDPAIALAADCGSLRSVAWAQACEELGALATPVAHRATDPVQRLAADAEPARWCPWWTTEQRAEFLAAASWAVQNQWGSHLIDEHTGNVTQMMNASDTNLAQAALACRDLDRAEWRGHLHTQLPELAGRRAASPAQRVATAAGGLEI